MTKDEMIELRKSIRLEIAREIEKLVHLNDRTNVRISEVRDDIKESLSLLTERIMTITSAENKLIAELERLRRHG